MCSKLMFKVSDSQRGCITNKMGILPGINLPWVGLIRNDNPTLVGKQLIELKGVTRFEHHGKLYDVHPCENRDHVIFLGTKGSFGHEKRMGFWIITQDVGIPRLSEGIHVIPHLPSHSHPNSRNSLFNHPNPLSYSHLRSDISDRFPCGFYILSLSSYQTISGK